MSYSNFVQARVVAPVAATATTLSLYAAEAPYQLPALDGGLLVLTDSPYKPSVLEVISYTSRSAQDLLGVVRGLEGTTAVEWSGNVYCYQSLMAGDFQAELDGKLDVGAVAADSAKLGGVLAADYWDKTNLVKQTDPTDTTAGALMAVGAFGVGAASLPQYSNTDLNVLPAVTQKVMGQAFTNAPEGDTGWFLIDQIVHNGDWVTQVAYGMSGLDERVFMRQKILGTWNGWHEVSTSKVPVWTAPTLTNGWVNYDTATFNSAGYYKRGGRVYLRGLIKGGTISSDAFALPVGYRPVKAELLATISNDATGRVVVRTSGSVSIDAPSQSTWVSLDNLSFAHT